MKNKFLGFLILPLLCCSSTSKGLQNMGKPKTLILKFRDEIAFESQDSKKIERFVKCFESSALEKTKEDFKSFKWIELEFSDSRERIEVQRNLIRIDRRRFLTKCSLEDSLFHIFDVKGFISQSLEGIEVD